MSNASTIPRDDASKLALLQHLNANLPNYAAILEVSADDLSQLQKGLAAFDYILKAQDAGQNYVNALFAVKRILRDGPNNAAVNLPPPPALPPGATARPCRPVCRHLRFSGRIAYPH